MNAWLASGYAAKIKDLSIVTAATQNIDQYLVRSTRSGAVTVFLKEQACRPI